MGPGLSARLNVVLLEPEIALNTGSIGRTCVAAGAMLWLVRPLGFHLDDRHLRRAGLDYWDHLDLRVVNSLGEAEQALNPTRLWYFSTKARQPYTDARFAVGDALVFGPETRGLPEQWLRDHPDNALRIPIRPQARSLNLANAVAIGGVLNACARLATRRRLKRESASDAQVACISRSPIFS